MRLHHCCFLKKVVVCVDVADPLQSVDLTRAASIAHNAHFTRTLSVSATCAYHGTLVHWYT
jgi:hypothetical protein